MNRMCQRYGNALAGAVGEARDRVCGTSYASALELLVRAVPLVVARLELVALRACPLAIALGKARGQDHAHADADDEERDRADHQPRKPAWGARGL